jgi:hypothetical protein
MNAVRMALVLAVTAATTMSLTMNTTRAAEPKTKVLRHVVMYKFKDSLPAAQLQQVIDAFAGLPGKIDAIIGFEKGTNVSPEGKSEGLTHVFVVTFRDEAGRDAYLKHPAHDAYVEVVKDKREKVVVFDYWAEE